MLVWGSCEEAVVLGLMWCEEFKVAFIFFFKLEEALEVDSPDSIFYCVVQDKVASKKDIIK